MKGNLIDANNQRFEAEIVRYFQNVNDKYLIYTKNEKDNSGFILLYLTKVISDNGIRIGMEITDPNEWSLITNFIRKTVAENKENKQLSIIDVNPIEVNDLKINAFKPFKLQESVVELFARNKKTFEIVQQMLDRQNTAIPVPPEVVEFVRKEPTVNANFADLFTPKTPVELPKVEEKAPEVVNEPIENKQTEVTATPNYEELYNKELVRNNELSKEIEELLKNNAELKNILDQIKELL